MSFEHRLTLSRWALVAVTLAVSAVAYARRAALGKALREFFAAATSPTNLAVYRIVFFAAVLFDFGNDYDPATVDTLNQLGGVNQHSAALLDHMVEGQAYMISTVEYFTMLGWLFFAMLIIIWFAKPPFGARPDAGNSH